VILEAFAEYLHAAEPNLRATEVLSQWLWQKLNADPITNVDRVLHCELSISVAKASNKETAEQPNLKYRRQAGERAYTFKGTSESGKRLLRSLYEYCCSYDQQKWSRWVHTLKASDFNGTQPSDR